MQHTKHLTGKITSSLTDFGGKKKKNHRISAVQKVTSKKLLSHLSELISTERRASEPGHEICIIRIIFLS